MSKKRRPKGPKTTLDYGAMMDLDLELFLLGLIQARSLFAVLEGLSGACRSRANRFAPELEKEDVHPTIKLMAEDEVEFFGGAAENIELPISLLKSDWKGRDMPTCADGTIRLTTRRLADAAQRHLEMLIGIINDPDATPEERTTAATKLAKEAHTNWIDQETGEPDFELAEAFAAATAMLVDPNTPEAEKREAAVRLQRFIFTNGERREGAGAQ